MSATLNISVIIPVFNCERYLAEAINSVLGQTLPAKEIIVVDDGSTDHSAEVALSFGLKIRYIKLEHGGIGAARNAGVAAMTTGHLAFLDSDDYWPNNKLGIQAGRLAESPHVDIVFGKVKQFVSPELSPESAARLSCPPELLKGIVAGTMLTTRRVFEMVGPFNEKLAVAEFIDWYARSTGLGFEVETIDAVLLFRRIHTSNAGIQTRHLRRGYVRVMKEYLDRNRAAQMRNSDPRAE